MANCFVLGVLVFYAALRPWVTLLVGALGATVLLAGLQVEMSTRVATVGTGVLILAAARRDKLDTWFCHPTLAWVGKVSFSLYLVHAPILSAGHHLGDKVGGTAGELAALVSGIGASFLAAYLMWRFVEQPAQRWSSRVKFEQRPVLRLA